jgi:hypothetical protein
VSLVGFTLLGTIEVPSITGSATAVPLLVKPNTEFTTAMLAALDSGGGDLRFGTEDGTTQYPCEIVDGLNIVWMTPTGLSVASAATVGVWGDNTGASQPAVGAPFGSEAVWVDFRYISHDGITDSTGNSTITFPGGTPTVGTGPLGSPSVILNGTDQYGRAGISSTLSTSHYYSSWIKQSSLTSGVALGEFSSSDAFKYQAVGVNGTGNATAYHRQNAVTVEAVSTSSITTNVWYEISASFVSDVSRSAYVNGSNKGTNTTSITASGTVDRRTYGRNDDSSPSEQLAAEIAELWLSDTSRTDDFISIKYDNLSTAAATAWWIAADAGGGTNAAITIPKPVFSSAAQAIAPVFNAAVNFTVSKPVFASTAQSVGPTTSGDVNFTIGKPEFSATAQAIPAGSGANADITISKPVFASTAQSIAPIITADVAFSITAPIFSATAQSLGLSTSADVSIAISKPEFSATAQAIGVDNNATVSFNIASPIFSVFAGGAVLEYYYAKDTQIVLIEKSKIITAPNKSRTLGV